MKKIMYVITCLAFEFSLSPLASALDQCDSTAQCRQTWSAATDCFNSASNNSICMCSSQQCDTLGGGASGVNIPGKIEAEDYVGFYDTSPGNAGNAHRTDDVDIQPTTDVGGGFNVGWIAANEWLEYPINVAAAGEYRADFRVASAPGNGMFTLEIDGITHGSATTVNPTGGWQNWQTKSINLGELNPGNQTLRIQVQAGNFNLNWIELASTSGGGGGVGMLGEFDLSKDLLLLHYDHTMDPDDNHANACGATMVRDPRFAGIDYHAVTGVNGRQGGWAQWSKPLYDLAFGNNWSDAAIRGNGTGPGRNPAVKAATETRIVNKMLTALDRGGDVWVAEGGQSDFTADVLRRVKAARPAINTVNRVHVVQHSNWNENQTTPNDLNYVRNNTDYRKIDDGNSANNSSPGFNNYGDSSQWARAIAKPGIGEVWKLSRDYANQVNRNPTRNRGMADGGMDFSDCAELASFTGFNNLRNVKAFFDEFGF
ncbi:carbohydrate-binding protein [Agarilytica rhodophyticola]|uniref:carbohydrate-binding protein n=1 Tax=Agarilytica rhodophyticola TaxID=1737490 RepID=UPI000B346807|nr:carbohydrate-binding protein [Agarilytica rhodophyticola]